MFTSALNWGTPKSRLDDGLDGDHPRQPRMRRKALTSQHTPQHTNRVHPMPTDPICGMEVGVGLLNQIALPIDCRRVQFNYAPCAQRTPITDQQAEELVRRAEELDSTKLRHDLEPAHVDEFVAIEPDSGDYFLGKTLSEATQAARKVHPDRLTHVMRVGHRAAIHFG